MPLQRTIGDDPNSRVAANLINRGSISGLYFSEITRHTDHKLLRIDVFFYSRIHALDGRIGNVHLVIGNVLQGPIVKERAK